MSDLNIRNLVAVSPGTVGGCAGRSTRSPGVSTTMSLTLLLCPGTGAHGTPMRALISVALHLSLSVFRLTERAFTTPLGSPILISSLRGSKPSHMPESHFASMFCGCCWLLSSACSTRFRRIPLLRVPIGGLYSTAAAASCHLCPTYGG